MQGAAVVMPAAPCLFFCFNECRWNREPRPWRFRARWPMMPQLPIPP